MPKKSPFVIALFSSILLITLPSSIFGGWTIGGAPVCLASGEQDRPRIVPNGSGGAIIVWEDRRTLTDIYAQFLDSMGRAKWALNGIPVCNAGNSQDRPATVEDGSGGAFVVWDDNRDDTQADIYVQRVDSNGTMLWTGNGVGACVAAGDQEYPEVCSDGAGGCIVAWIDERTSSNGDIYAQRFDPDGTPLWTADGIAVCVNDTIQIDMKMISDGSGGAIITWADYRNEDLQLYGQRVNSSGNALWAVDGTRLSPSSDPQYDHNIATDTHGGVFVTWCERRIATLDIYLQRVTSSGNQAFTSGGIAVCGLNETQRYPEITADGTGGAIVAWEDYRDLESDLYAQRYDASGNALWPVANGTPVCIHDPAAIFDPVLYPDGSGGAIIAWSDNRDAVTNGYDVYAQRIGATGTALWDENGRAFCTAPSSQAALAATTNGGGGVILAWRDYRNPDFDIYAQMIAGDGEVVAAMLQSFSLLYRNGVVQITWRLAETGESMEFFVFRRNLASGYLTAIADPAIEGDGRSFTFIDESLDVGASFIYRVEISDEDGRRILFETEAVTTPAARIELAQNYPNPFNPATIIQYSVPERCRVSLSIFDVSGTLVARLVDCVQEAGPHSVSWNGTDAGGRSVPSGIYLYRLTAGKETVSRKMALLR